jgi:MFS family permease
MESQAVADEEEWEEVEDLPRALPTPIAAAIVFLAAGAVLMLEILAVRLLAPYVGLTLEATTAIIGAALAGIAAGAAIGGYLADRTNTRLLVVGLLVLGGILALIMVPLVRWLGPGARGKSDLVTLVITFAALVPSAAVLSAVSPAVAHLQLHDLHVSGTVVGRLSAWATAGALVGTFGTGFVLIPIMPVSTAVLCIGAVLIVLGLALGFGTRLLSAGAVAGIFVVALAVGGASATIDSPCELETKYHCVHLEEEKPGEFQLLLDDGYHSFVDVDDPTHLVYPYTQWVAEAIDEKYPAGKPLDVVAVGGGGFTLPLWVNATRPGSHVEVLEVDGELAEFVEDRFGFEPSSDLEVTIGDARLTMRDLEPDSADVVIGDAYSSDSIPWHLATTEWLDEVRRVLKPDGVYMQNILDFQPLDLARAEVATLLDRFSDVRMVTFRKPEGSLEGGATVLFASDRPLGKVLGRNPTVFSGYTPDSFTKPEVEQFAAGADVLTDDFAPADQLLTNE